MSPIQHRRAAPNFRPLPRNSARTATRYARRRASADEAASRRSLQGRGDRRRSGRWRSSGVGRASVGRAYNARSAPANSSTREDESAMDAYAGEWLQFLIRWVHLITGIAWIGASFYFIWLDNH